MSVDMRMDLHLMLSGLTPLARTALRSIANDQTRGLLRVDQPRTAMRAGMSLSQFGAALSELEHTTALRVEFVGADVEGTSLARFHLCADPSTVLMCLRRLTSGSDT